MIEIREFIDIWNDLHCKYIKQGAEIRNELMADWCEQQILAAKKDYYETENSLYSDEAYDSIEMRLKILRPESKILDKVGS